MGLFEWVLLALISGVAFSIAIEKNATAALISRILIKGLSLLLVSLLLFGIGGLSRIVRQGMRLMHAPARLNRLHSTRPEK